MPSYALGMPTCTGTYVPRVVVENEMFAPYFSQAQHTNAPQNANTKQVEINIVVSMAKGQASNAGTNETDDIPVAHAQVVISKHIASHDPEVARANTHQNVCSVPTRSDSMQKGIHSEGAPISAFRRKS